MKKKSIITAALFALAMSASAQVEFIHTTFGRNTVCYDKGIFWMDGDSDPSYTISNYKKVGNKVTFHLKKRENTGIGSDYFNVTITLKNDKPADIVMKGNDITYSSPVMDYRTEADGDPELVRYFRKEAGYPDTGNITGNPAAAAGNIVSNPASATGNVKDAANSIGDAAKKTFNKVKGLLKKKK